MDTTMSLLRGEGAGCGSSSSRAGGAIASSLASCRGIVTVAPVTVAKGAQACVRRAAGDSRRRRFGVADCTVTSAAAATALLRNRDPHWSHRGPRPRSQRQEPELLLAAVWLAWGSRHSFPSSIFSFRKGIGLSPMMFSTLLGV